MKIKKIKKNRKQTKVYQYLVYLKNIELPIQIWASSYEFDNGCYKFIKNGIYISSISITLINKIMPVGNKFNDNNIKRI